MSTPLDTVCFVPVRLADLLRGARRKVEAPQAAVPATLLAGGLVTNPIALALWTTLASHYEVGQRHKWPGTRLLADVVGVSRDTLKVAVAALVAAGCLTTHMTRGRYATGQFLLAELPNPTPDQRAALAKLATLTRGGGR